MGYWVIRGSGFGNQGIRESGMNLISRIPDIQILISRYPNTYDEGRGMCIGKALTKLDGDVGVVDAIVMVQ